MEKNIEQVLSSFDVTKMLAQVTADQKNIMHDLRVRKHFDSIPPTLSKKLCSVPEDMKTDLQVTKRKIYHTLKLTFYRNKEMKQEYQFLKVFVKDLFFVVQRTNLTSFPKKADAHFW